MLFLFSEFRVSLEHCLCKLIRAGGILEAASVAGELGCDLGRSHSVAEFAHRLEIPVASSVKMNVCDLEESSMSNSRLNGHTPTGLYL